MPARPCRFGPKRVTGSLFKRLLRCDLLDSETALSGAVRVGPRCGVTSCLRQAQALKSQGIPMRKVAPSEQECGACNGTELSKVKQPSKPGHRIYPPSCTKCGGRGRVPRTGQENGQPERTARLQKLFIRIQRLCPRKWCSWRRFSALPSGPSWSAGDCR